MIKNATYTVIATSNWVSPEIHRHLTKEQAESLAWQYKNEQYKVNVEMDEPLIELGICQPID